jgi:hypothetical protein
VKDETRDEDTSKTHIYIYIYMGHCSWRQTRRKLNLTAQIIAEHLKKRHVSFDAVMKRIAQKFPKKFMHHAKTSTVTSEILSTRRVIFSENVTLKIHVCVIQENVPQAYEGHQQSETFWAVFLLSLPTRNIMPINIYIYVACSTNGGEEERV